MTDTTKRLYRFLVEMGRLTPEEYEQITGEAYVVQN